MPVETPSAIRALPPVSSTLLTAVKSAQQASRTPPSTTNPPVIAEPSKTPEVPVPTTPDPKLPDTSKSIEAPPKTPEGDGQAGFKEALKNDKETNLANLRKAREDAETRAELAERRAKELEGKIPLESEIQKLREDRDLLITEIEKRDVTASPRFKEKYDKPLEQQLGQISKTLKTAKLTDVKPEDFSVVVQMPESTERTSKLEEMIEGLDRISSGKVLNAISEYDRIREARSLEIGNPSEAWQATQRERQEAERQRSSQTQQIMASTIEKTRKMIPWFKPIEGNEVWNTKISEVEKRASSFWSGGHSPEELAELTLAGSLVPMYAEGLLLAQQENERLNSELAEYREAKPRTSTGSVTSSSASLGKTNIADVYRQGAYKK